MIASTLHSTPPPTPVIGSVHSENSFNSLGSTRLLLLIVHIHRLCQKQGRRTHFFLGRDSTQVSKVPCSRTQWHGTLYDRLRFEPVTLVSPRTVYPTKGPCYRFLGITSRGPYNHLRANHRISAGGGGLWFSVSPNFSFHLLNLTILFLFR